MRRRLSWNIIGAPKPRQPVPDCGHYPAPVLALATGRRMRARRPSRGAAFLGCQCPAGKQKGTDVSGPVVTFTKWVTGNVLVPDNLEWAGSSWKGSPEAIFGHLRRGGASRATESEPGPENGGRKLEAIYEVHNLNGNHVLTALVPGCANRATGAALLDGVILAGSRTGARVVWSSNVPLPPTGPPDARAPADRNCLVGQST